MCLAHSAHPIATPLQGSLFHLASKTNILTVEDTFHALLPAYSWYMFQRSQIFGIGILPERDYVTFGSLLSPIRLSVTLVHPTQTVEPFGNISSPLCSLATLGPPHKILQRSFKGNPSIERIKRKRGSKIQRFRTCLRLYLINGTR